MVGITATQALRYGVAAHKAGNFVEAERYYRAAVRSHSIHSIDSQNKNTQANAYGYLGVVLQHQGKLKAAIDCYQRAIEIKPDYAEVYHLLVYVLRERGDAQAAIECCQRAVRNLPDNVDVHNNLGAALQYKGELDAAIRSYQHALKLDPDCAEAYNNMASAQHAAGELDSAINNYNRALAIRPDYINACNNLGNALQEKGELQAAIDCYNTALALQPDAADAHNNLGNLLRETGQYDAAIKHFDALKTIVTNPSDPEFWFNSRSQVLECLYILGRYEEMEQRLKLLSGSDEINLRIAAVSAFVCHQLQLEDPYPFCKNPLDFVQVGKLDEHVEDVDSFVQELIQEAGRETQLWEPKHGVTKRGFQTAPTIFKAGQFNQALEQILRKEIDSYHDRLGDADCAYMRLWPETYELRGWFCRLVKHGHQQAHNHPSGWLSGVVYLKTVDSPDTDEGAIELSLHGHNLPIIDHDFARHVHRPAKGDILLFPSSVFHRTIPFQEDTERCVIAFDLYRYTS